jgi:2-phosphoglycerate kinase
MKQRDLRVVRGEAKYTFSTGAVVESLQGAGVSTDEAMTIARETERYYRHQSGNVELGELVSHLADAAAREAGPELANRFLQQTPPFVPLLVASEEESSPFSRRVLAASLEKLGLSFKEAYAVARQVEQTLRTEGYETVGARDLVHLTAVSLEARVGRKVRLRYEAQAGEPTDLQVVEEGGVRFPYSRGILAQSLMAVGLGPGLSHNLAKRTEDALWRMDKGMGKREIERATIRRVVRLLVQQEAGEEFARRYELMRSVRRPERPIVILIGGAPGVGKSTLAAELAYRLGIPRLVSSDSLRQALRSLISPELSPALHRSSFSAWEAELLPGERASAAPERKRVIRGFQRQVQQLATALFAVVSRNIEESTSVVLEGIHLVPGFTPVERFSGATVVELVFVVSDPEVHRNHFSTREAKTDARRSSKNYLEHFAEIRILQDFILGRAEEEGVPVIEATDVDAAVDQAVEHVLGAVLIERDEGGKKASPQAAEAPRA